MSRVGGIAVGSAAVASICWYSYVPYVVTASTEGHGRKVGAGAEVIRHSACSPYCNWLTCSNRASRHQAKLPCELSSIGILPYKRL